MKIRPKIAQGVAALALVVVIGFAFSRGYFMHYVVEGQSYSRDEFLALVDEATRNPDIRISCAQGAPALGWLYVYEVHCFDTEEEVLRFMNVGQP